MSVADGWSEGIGSALSLIPIPGMKYVGKYGTEGAVVAGKGLGKFLGFGVKGIGKGPNRIDSGSDHIPMT